MNTNLNNKTNHGHCERSEAIWLENSRHPELDSGSTRHCERSEAISSRLSRATALAMTNETGRSMVEMLGVLGVIGVLSITGISGYNTAMNKHRANEILDAASKRAVAVSTQIQRGNTSPTLDEFGDETTKGVSFSLKATDGNAWATGQSRFALQTSAIDEDICREIYNITGTSGTVREMYSDSNALSSSSGCSETASAMRFVYNNDMSSVDIESSISIDEPCDPACSSGNICLAGKCSSFNEFILSEATGYHADLVKLNNKGNLCPKGYKWASYADIASVCGTTWDEIENRCDEDTYTVFQRYVWLADCHPRGESCPDNLTDNSEEAYYIAYSDLNHIPSADFTETNALCIK